MLEVEQAALRHVATLVAQEPEPKDVFDAVVDETRRVLGVPLAGLFRYEHDGTATMLAATPNNFYEVGASLPLDGDSVLARIFRTGRHAHLADYTGIQGPIAERLRATGNPSVAGSPIVVEGELWGALLVFAQSAVDLGDDVEERLAGFIELVGTAIANAQAHDELRALAEEQAALRRVATLVADGVPPAEIFASVSHEVERVFGLDRDPSAAATVVRFDPGSECVLVGAAREILDTPLGMRWQPHELFVSTRVLRSGRPARVEAPEFDAAEGPDAEKLRQQGYLCQVGSPIVVDGRLWGAMTVSRRESLPRSTEERLEKFTELIGTAIANVDAREDLRELAGEQAALRRVATLVAEGPDAAELFSAVAREVANVLGVDMVSIDRYEGDSSVVLASVNDPGFPQGSRWPLAGASLGATVLETARPARVDDYSLLSSASAEAAREWKINSTVGAPIVVGGEVWGIICVGTDTAEALPAGTEERLLAFTELVGTAIANAEARAALHRLADEQAALRRVAILVAEGATPTELFTAVAEEVAHVVGAPGVSVDRYEPDGTTTVLAAFGESPFPVGTTWPIDPGSVSARILETGRPASVHDYAKVGGEIGQTMRAYPSAAIVGVPIIVDGTVWGSISVGSVRRDLLADDTEIRLAGFTELVATAISNMQAHAELNTLADEQAALQRLATLVAEGASAAEVFATVAEEVAGAFGVAGVTLDRYDPDEMTTVLATWGETGFEAGTRWPLDEGSLARTVLETGRPARIDDYSELPGVIGEAMRRIPGISTVGVPVVADGAVWGIMCVGTGGNRGTLPADTESRLHAFTQLVGTAVSNASTSAELLASRARIVAAGDEVRRRIERNLHDGAQQRLVALGLDVQALRGRIPDEHRDARAGLERVADELVSVLDGVREISRGLHPALLARQGLPGALRALARRSPLEVELVVDVPVRPPEPIEIGVYYVVAEALANAASHAHASLATVWVVADGATLRATVEDDGVGGADPAAGTGLVGLTDRVEALGGRFALESPRGEGTRISIELPL